MCRHVEARRTRFVASGSHRVTRFRLRVTLLMLRVTLFRVVRDASGGRAALSSDALWRPRDAFTHVPHIRSTRDAFLGDQRHRVTLLRLRVTLFGPRVTLFGQPVPLPSNGWWRPGACSTLHLSG